MYIFTYTVCIKEQFTQTASILDRFKTDKTKIPWVSKNRFSYKLQVSDPILIPINVFNIYVYLGGIEVYFYIYNEVYKFLKF